LLKKKNSDFVEEEEFLRGNTTITDFGNDFCDEDNKCSICQGGCNRDRDCQDGLECMIRDGNETVPGCEGADLEENGKRKFNFFVLSRHSLLTANTHL
jgi:hypothetical protein